MIWLAKVHCQWGPCCRLSTLQCNDNKLQQRASEGLTAGRSRMEEAMGGWALGSSATQEGLGPLAAECCLPG